METANWSIEITEKLVMLKAMNHTLYFPHHTFESMAREFWKQQSVCKTIYGGWNIENSVFSYTKESDVVFTQKCGQIILSYENAKELFDFYHKNHTFSIDWVILGNGAVLNNCLFISKMSINCINNVYRFYLDASWDYEELGGKVYDGEENFYTFVVADNSIKIYYNKNDFVAFDSNEWNIFLAEIKGGNNG